MMLENKLNITDQTELDIAEETIGKQKAKQLFDSGDLSKVQVGESAGLLFIHEYLFSDIYPFAGQLRTVDIAKGGFLFAPVRFLPYTLQTVSGMPQHDFDTIVDKYIEMNIAHPFRDGNGRSTRIWLDLILKQEIQQVVDWRLICKPDYFSAMISSADDGTELKNLLKPALSSNINDRGLFMECMDVSFYYEGFGRFKTEDV